MMKEYYEFEEDEEEVELESAIRAILEGLLFVGDTSKEALENAVAQIFEVFGVNRGE